MIHEYAIYESETGNLLRIVTCRPSQIAGQCQPGELFCGSQPGLTTHLHRLNLITGKIEDVLPAPLDILAEARAHRDRLLSASDWTQAPDNRLTQEQRQAWANVREQWRVVVDDIKRGLPAQPWADEPA